MPDEAPNTPLAMALVGGAALCAFMAARSWPTAGGTAVRPAAYAQSVLQGAPLDQGPAPANDTGGIEAGLAAILGIWTLSKLAGVFSNFPDLLGGGDSSGSGEDDGGDEGEGGEGGEGGGEGVLGELGGLEGVLAEGLG